MTLLEFLTLLLPEEGFKFLQYGASPNVYRSATNAQGMADAIGDIGPNTNIWFAMAAFEEREYTDSDGKVKRRTQENAVGAKSLWLDIDAGKDKAAKGKGYASQAEALAAVSAFCDVTGLPIPLRVDSGNGIHCYWPLEKTVRKQTWNKLAGALDTLVKKHGLLADSSRTKDISSLLRPIETQNRKNPDYPKLVKMVGLHERVVDAKELAPILLHKSEDDTPAVGVKPKGIDTSINDDLALPAEAYPDVDGEALANSCAQIGFFRDTGSNDYTHWFRSIGTVKHAVGGEQLCHEWSAKSPQYTQRETQFKIDEWKTGPATCAAFEDHNGLCSGCPHYGKITSPIRLGFVNKTTVEIATDDVDPEHEVEQHATTSIELPEPFSLDHKNRLCVTLKKMVKPPKGAPPGTAPTWEEDTFHWCDVFFYPADRIQGDDGEMQQRLRVRIRDKWKEITIPTHLVAGGKDLHKALAKYEVVVSAKYKPILDDYLVAFTNKLRELKEAIHSYRTFGWQQDGGLIIGDRMYSDGVAKRIELGNPNAAKVAKSLTPTGGLADWVQAVEAMYNRDDYQQYQFVVYSGFGSLLVHLLGYNASTVLSLYGGRGQGKTTSAKVALSVYGDPEALSTTWKDGSTFKANLLQLATFKSLPYLVDEFSNAEGKELSQAAYTFANGKARVTSGIDQQLRSSGDTWHNITIVTTNMSLHDILATHKDDASAEISRVIEIEWQAGAKGVDKNEMMDLYATVVANRGTAGDVFAKYVSKHRAQCETVVKTLAAQVDRAAGFTSESRFWSVLIATALAGGYIATKLGLLTFDFAAVKDYGMALGRKHISKMPSVVNTPLESFHAMLTAFANRIITTPSEGDRHGASYDVKVIGEPIGRVVLDQGIAYVCTNAVREWCSKKAVSFNQIRAALEDSGTLLEADVKYYIGKGTRLSTGQMRCWKIDWSQINSHSSVSPSHLQLVKP